MPFEHVSIKPKYIFTVTYSIQLDKSARSFEKVLTLYGFGVLWNNVCAIYYKR